MRKAVLISIRPAWCQKIANGEKTIEVRKNRPKLAPPFKCYIYCTQAKYPHEDFIETEYPKPQFYGGGKIIGEFTCKGFIPFSHGRPCFVTGTPEEIARMACLTRKEIWEYAPQGNPIGWRITDLVIYDTPHELFFKKPPSRIETINDLDGEIINLFRCIREQPEELMRAVACTPYSRGEYEQAWDHFKAGGQVRPDGIEAARLTLVRYWQAHGSTVVYKGGWKNDRAGREYAYDVRYWRQLPERIAAVVERLKDAQIEQAPAVDVIRRFRHPDVLIYADPPYMLHTRKGKQYIVEMAEEAQHIELLDALKEHPGPVILSGYDNDLYNEHLQGWKKLHRRAQAEGGAARTETVWLNYVPETGGKVYETV